MWVAVTGDTVRVAEGDEIRCRVAVEDWTNRERTPDLDYPVQATIDGRASSLRFPPGRVSLAGARSDGGEVTAGPLHAGVDEDIRIDAGVTAFLSVDGAATVDVHPRGIEVSIDAPRPLTLGVRAREERSDRTITVPGTPEGIATAITYARAAHETSGPGRSDPQRRPPPPAIELGDAVHVPDAIRAATPETGITLQVPRDLDALFVLAPLAYYLGADVEVEPRDRPVLCAPSVGVERRLPGLPRLQASAASILYRTATLDSLLRDARRARPAVDSERLLSAAGLDASELDSASTTERLAAYLGAAFDEVAPALPEWHLSMYVTARPEHVSSLSYILDRLAFVYLPDASKLDTEERIQRSLEDFYRGVSDAPSVDPLVPDLNRGRVHGWLADGVPIDAFTFLPEAYQNRLTRSAGDGEDTTVTLVQNDPDMGAEGETIRRTYRERAEDFGIDLRVERGLDREALAAAIERPTGLFHYVGHCEESGLCCVDGNLPVADVERSGARTFLLNACGSYHEGAALVRKGSVAGAVTLQPVLDDQATRVGTAFTQLVTAGFAVERAIRIACRRAIMNKDYTVVGDGSYAIASPRGSTPALVRVTPDDDGFHVHVQNGPARSTGEYRPSLLDDGGCLSGSEASVRMSRAELRAFLDRRSLPVIYRNRYYWSDDLVSRLSHGDSRS